MRSTADLLGNYIRSAHPYRRSPQEQAVFFEGESDSLTLISAYSHGMGGRGMAEVRIGHRKKGSTAARCSASKKTTPVRVGEEETSAGQVHRVVLREGIRNFRLAYLDPQLDEESWEERWDGEERRMLPRAVRLSLRRRRRQEVRWIFPLMMVVLTP